MSGIFAPLAIMLSPRGLTIAGNGAGIGGVVFLGVLLLCAAISLRTAHSITSIPDAEGKLGRWYFPAVLGVLDASRLLALTMLCVSWLGLAGYAINEIFIHWFPNLGASFTLLGLALAVCFIPNGNGKWLFRCFLFLAGGVFLYISAMGIQPPDTGLWYPSALPLQIQNPIPADLLTGAGPWMQLIFISLVAVMGFDLAVQPGGRTIRSFPSLLFMLLIFSLFTWAAILLISPERLERSYIPHIIVAKAIFGDTGRLLIGLTIVLGSLAAVLATLQSMGHRIARLCKKESSPLWHQVTATVIAIITGVLMATGWAGEEALEALISAGLCFWFSAYALIDLGNILYRKQSGNIAVISVLALILHVFGAVMAIYTTEFPVHFLGSLGGILALGFLLMFLHKRAGYYPATSSHDDHSHDTHSTSTASHHPFTTASSSSTNSSVEHMSTMQTAENSQTVIPKKSKRFSLKHKE